MLINTIGILFKITQSADCLIRLFFPLNSGDREIFFIIIMYYMR